MLTGPAEAPSIIREVTGAAQKGHLQCDLTSGDEECDGGADNHISRPKHQGWLPALERHDTTPGRFRSMNENNESVKAMMPRKCTDGAERSKAKPRRNRYRCEQRPMSSHNVS